MRGLLQRLTTVFGTALILMWGSEYLFVNEGPAETVFETHRSGGFFATVLATLELGIFYVSFAYPFLICLTFFRVHSWTGAVLAASMYGLAVEALLVPLIYENIPYSIIWPSLSWHLIVDVGAVWLGLRLALRARTALVPILASLSLGAFWALQATWYWVGLEPGGLPKLSHDQFTTLVFGSFPALFIGIVLTDAMAPYRFKAHRIEIALVTIISILLLAATGRPYGLAPLLIASVVIVFLAALWQERRFVDQTANWPPLLNLANRPAAWRYGILGLIPISALATYAVLLESELQLPTAEMVQFLYLTGATAVGLALLSKTWVALRRR